VLAPGNSELDPLHGLVCLVLDMHSASDQQPSDKRRLSCLSSAWPGLLSWLRVVVLQVWRVG
jgi:hypothetical protein